MRKVSKTDSTVLITGETGTGKELVAQSIHNLSKRMNKPFVSQNCGAIPEKLLESLLFGTVKGAFTGAENMVGLLESAAGGTVFLDEINSLPLELQMKLLKVLEERKFRRLGGTEEIYTDTRFIAATNQDVRKLAQNGLFRPDLYYRISALSVELPRLSARRGDVELLANHFINYYNFKMRKNIEHIPKSILSIFQSYTWPGNMRELRNVIERIFNLSENGEITQDYLPNEMRFPETYDTNSVEARFEFDNVPWNDATGATDLKQMVKEYEYALICHTYQKHNENLSKTAEALQISRQLLKYKMDRE
jgi:arginine utilization regulatory protein